MEGQGPRALSAELLSDSFAKPFLCVLPCGVSQGSGEARFLLWDTKN